MKQTHSPAQDETKSQMQRMATRLVSITGAATVFGMAHADFVSDRMAGQQVWMRFLASGVPGGLTAGIAFLLLSKVWPDRSASPITKG
jgi:hypothetical protein